MDELISKLCGLAVVIIIIIILVPGTPTLSTTKTAVQNLGGPFNIYGGVVVLLVAGFFSGVFFQYIFELVFQRLLIWLRKRGYSKKKMNKLIDSLHKTFISWDKKVYYKGMIEKWY